MKNGVFTYNDESYNFDFKTSLSAYEKLLFVKKVVNTLVNDGGYDSIIRDLVFDFVIVDVFTNIDTSFVYAKDENGNDIPPIFIIEHFLKESNAVGVVRANVDHVLIDELNHAIDLDIQYLTGIHPNPLNEAIASLLSTLENKVNDFDLDGMMNMAKKLSSVTGDFTIDNLVKAYIESDVHKANLAEIEESKN